jgi:hypothetical protein
VALALKFQPLKVFDAIAQAAMVIAVATVITADMTVPDATMTWRPGMRPRR